MAKRIAALTIIFVTLSSAPAQAWEHLHEEVRWPCQPIGVQVTMDGPAGRLAKMAVRELDAASPLEFVLVESGGVVTVGFGRLEPGYAGVAPIHHDGRVIFRAEVIVSRSVEMRWMKATLLHELGHVAGLDHSTERSVMNMQGVPWKSYQADDLEGLGELGCRG